MNPEGIKQVEKELAEQFEMLKNHYTMSQQELAKTDLQYTEEILKLIQKAVGKIVESKKFDYVFEKKSVLFGGIDITKEVIKEVNNLYKEEKKKKK
jgi:outer membrane protein